MLAKVTPFPVWAAFPLPAVRGTCFRKVVQQITRTRQLVCYLTHVCTGLTIVSIQVEQTDSQTSNVASYQARGLTSHDLRTIFADDCVEQFLAGYSGILELKEVA